MEIVTSHDPNKMSTNGMFINYRLVRFKRVKFKTRFQNNGEGPARMIRLETDVPLICMIKLRLKLKINILNALFVLKKQGSALQLFRYYYNFKTNNFYF